MPRGHGGHGGKRPGAGRKPGERWPRTIERDAAYQLYRETVLAHMAPLVQAQVEAALGKFAKVFIVESTDGGMKLRQLTTELELEAVLKGGFKHRIVLCDPDLPMSRYLTDQVVGKPTEHVEVSGPDGEPLVIGWKS